MAKARIHVVEDEKDILELIQLNLEREGYKVKTVENGEDCIKIARDKVPDLLILDLMLPGMDGLDVCRIMKNDSKTRHIPIIMLTAKGEESDMITGLEMGADDYMTKPFSPKVLTARVKAVLRKVSIASGEEGVIKKKDMIIDQGRREVLYKGKKVDLTFTEFELLYLLSKRPGWVFTRNQIVQAVKGDGYPVTERAIDVQIVGLRKKLGDACSFIETIRGVGYRFRD